MPYSIEHKQKSREKILNSAVACFCEKGFDNSSIDEIMQRAKLTRGAFYAHFSSKSELYQQALMSGASNSPLLRLKPDAVSDREWLKLLVKGYLSEQHIENKQPSCPLAFLVTDVAVNDPEVRKTYTALYNGMNQRIHKNANTYGNCDKSRIYAITAMMIGAVAIGRALDDRKTRKAMLSGCESLALAILNGQGDTLNSV